MAENKKSFIAYVDWKETFDSLPDEKAGQLVKHLFAYVSDENPKSDDILINAVFANIKQQLKRDLAKWRDTSTQRADIGRIGGIKSGEARRSKTKQTKQTLQTGSKMKQNEHDNVNDNDNDNVKEEESKMPDKPADFIDQIIDCFVKEHGSYEVLNRGKERAAASKILNEYKKKYPAATSEETLTGLQSYFRLCINIPDVWLMNNMSPSIIVSKFNEINKILKNGNNKSGATDSQIAGLLANKLGVVE